MSPAEIHNIADHIKTQLVCSECGAPGQGSCHCGAPYVKPGERAEAVVKANPEKSSYVLAEETGIPQSTINRAQRKIGKSNDLPEKRIGRDGNRQKASKPKRKTPQEKFKAAAQARRNGKSQTEAAKDAGLNSPQSVKIAEAYEEGWSDCLEQLDVDPDTLALSAKAKLEVAKRMIQRKLEAEHAARMRNVNEEVRQRVLKEGKEHLARLNEMEAKAREAEKTYRDFFNQQPKLLTVDQWKLIMLCVHEDTSAGASAAKRHAASQLLNEKRFALTGEKK